METGVHDGYCSSLNVQTDVMTDTVEVSICRQLYITDSVQVLICRQMYMTDTVQVSICR
jgi:hypothetical protein